MGGAETGDERSQVMDRAGDHSTVRARGSRLMGPKAPKARRCRSAAQANATGKRLLAAPFPARPMSPCPPGPAASKAMPKGLGWRVTGCP